MVYVFTFIIFCIGIPVSNTLEKLKLSERSVLFNAESTILHL